MAELKRTFTGGKMDKDTDERIVQNGLYREALNISVATSEDSDVGAAQNILGNTKVTDVIQHREYTTSTSGYESGDGVYFGENYHVAAIIDPQTNKLYRFVHTASEDEGVWMDRIIEFDTSKKLSDPWDEKEHAVFVDIFKVKAKIETYEDGCGGGAGTGQIARSSIITLTSFWNKNINQIRWGMRVDFGNVDATVVRVDYATKKIYLDRSIPSYTPQQFINFYGDRNLNFGDVVGGIHIKSITGINIVDGMIFWTDNNSEPKKINIERSKEGSDGSQWASVGRGIKKIDDFNQHTLLIVEDENPKDIIIDEAGCYTAAGCTDVTALNWNPAAQYDCNNDPFPSQNPDHSCCIHQAGGCTDAKAPNYDPNANFDDGSCCYIEGCMDDGYCATDETQAANMNADCASGTIICEDASGNVLNSPFHVCGYLSSSTSHPTSNLSVFGNEACNFEPNACVDDGSCMYDGCNGGCMSQSASNYDSSADFDDGSCLYWIFEDCDCVESPSIKRVNYPSESDCDTANPALTGCCADVPNYGCTDTAAINYDANADCACDNTLMGCDNTVGNACDGPGSNECCEYVVSGCTDPNDINYNPLAVVNDGSCQGVEGCTDANACNYDCATIVNPNSTTPCSDSVNIDDNTCDYTSCVGCTDPLANNTNCTASNCVDDGSCTYNETWECIQSYWGCVQIFGGTASYPGSFSSEADCVYHCQAPTWDCGGNGVCYDPGTGNGAFSSQSLCQLNCAQPYVASWECDLYGSNAGSCFDPGDGSGTYNASNGGLTACEAACDPIAATWDCDGQGNCSSNTTGTGMFTSLPACQNYCRVPATYDCISGYCVDPQNGNGQYPNYSACLISGCLPPLTTMGWDCDLTNNTCFQVAGGAYTSQSDCIANSPCSGGSSAKTYNCVITAPSATGTSITPGSISCVDPGDGTGGYTDAGAPSIYGDAQTWCESDMNNPTSGIAGCRDWSSTCDTTSGPPCTSNLGGVAAYGTVSSGTYSLTNHTSFAGTWGPSDMGANAAGIHNICNSNCNAAPAVTNCQDRGAWNYNQNDGPCYYPGCCANKVSTTNLILPSYQAVVKKAVGNNYETITYSEFDYKKPPNSEDAAGNAIGPNNPHPGCPSDAPYFSYGGLWDGYATPATHSYNSWFAGGNTGAWSSIQITDRVIPSGGLQQYAPSSMAQAYCTSTQSTSFVGGDHQYLLGTPGTNGGNGNVNWSGANEPSGDLAKCGPCTQFTP